MQGHLPKSIILVSNGKSQNGSHKKEGSCMTGIMVSNIATLYAREIDKIEM